MNYLVIYPGRFHPFHKGHRASYEWLTKQFGNNAVFIATSAVQAPVTSPFSYSDKVMMMTKLDIPVGRIANVKNPYQAVEITDGVPDELKNSTALVFAVSEKDVDVLTLLLKKTDLPVIYNRFPKTKNQSSP